MFTLISLLILALFLVLIYWIAGKFVQGSILQIIGAILAVIWVVEALRRLGIFHFDF